MAKEIYMGITRVWCGTAIVLATLAAEPVSLHLAAQAASSSAPGDSAATRWVRLSAEGKLLYAAGLLDGALLVRSTLMPPGAAADRERAVDRNVAPRLTPEKLRSGIDTFFQDPLNRNINVAQAATVVLLTASGANATVIDSAIQTFRKVAPGGTEPTGPARSGR